MRIVVLANLKKNAPTWEGMVADQWDDLDSPRTPDAIVAALQSGGHEAVFMEASIHPPYNLIERGIEVEIFPQAVVEDIAIMAYRPLSMGFFAGKYDPDQLIPTDSRGHTDERIGEWMTRFGDGLRAFLRFAADHNLHPAQLAIAWARYAPAVTTPFTLGSMDQSRRPT